MAKKRSWSRYQPPAEKRTEDGQRVQPKQKPAAKPRPQQSRRPAKPTPTPAKQTGSAVGGLIALVVVVAVIVIIAVVVAVNSDSDDDNNPDLDLSLLTVDFIGDTLAKATAEEGSDAVSVRLDEYGMTVEYFDPNKRQSRYFETRGYREDGYTLRVEKSYYDDYQPRPFDLSVLEPEDLVAAVEEALERTDDIYTYSLRVEADRQSGDVSIVTNVSGDDSISVTRAP